MQSTVPIDNSRVVASWPLKTLHTGPRGAPASAVLFSSNSPSELQLRSCRGLLSLSETPKTIRPTPTSPLADQTGGTGLRDRSLAGSASSCHGTVRQERWHVYICMLSSTVNTSMCTCSPSQSLPRRDLRRAHLNNLTPHNFRIGEGCSPRPRFDGLPGRLYLCPVLSWPEKAHKPPCLSVLSQSEA